MLISVSIANLISLPPNSSEECASMKKHVWAAILDFREKNNRNFHHVPLTRKMNWKELSTKDVYISPRWLSHYVRKYTYVLDIQGVKLTSANWTFGKHNIPYSLHQASPLIKHCPRLRAACQSKNIGERRPRISIAFIYNNMMWCSTCLIQATPDWIVGAAKLINKYGTTWSNLFRCITIMILVWSRLTFACHEVYKY